MPQTKFLHEYKKLNPEQKQAVDAIEGPVMVIAGPGTGKTKILTLRIANILRQTDTAPENILALTFTESGVFSMRKNLVDIIGSAGYRVHIATFHGFCNDVIKRFPDEFPRIIGANPIDTVDKLSILKEVILASNLTKLKPFGDNFYYLRPLEQKIGELKRENISPQELKAILKKQEAQFKKIPDLYYTKGRYKGEMKGMYRTQAKGILKNKELLKVYELYERELEKRRLYDYEDMIVETIGALLESRDLLLTLQEEFHYILADEHQDANNSQNRLLELLASFHENPNLFIVGDEKQAIFRFQGASLDNFLYFKNLYPEALLVTLLTNYRSTQEILDSAHSVMEKRKIPYETVTKRLTAKNGKGAVLELRAFSKPEYEYYFLADDIARKIEEGVEPGELAVLYRNNRDAEALIRVLEKTDIPFVVESDEFILKDRALQKLVLLLRALNGYGNDELLLRVLHFDFWNIPALDVYRLAKYAYRTRQSAYDLLESKKKLREAGVKNVGKLYGISKLFALWKELSLNRALLDFLDIVVRESGWLASVLGGEQSKESLDRLHALYDTVESLIENHRDYGLAELTGHLDVLEEYNLSIKKKSREITPRSVRLMTAHRSKGLEFDYVYLAGAYDGHWGNQRTREHFIVPLRGTPVSGVLRRSAFVPRASAMSAASADIDDERRLFYVALTRARLGVAISYARENENGKEVLPSQFVEEIDPRYLKAIDTSSFEKSIEKTTRFAPQREKKTRIKDREYLHELFVEQGLSVTALNNYLECPWQYFYSNLIRVPKAPNKHIMFGWAVHAALKYFFDAWHQGRMLGEEQFVAFFEDRLLKQPLSLREYEETLEKGKHALRGYYRKYKDSWPHSLINEYDATALLPVHLPKAPALKLRGVLDKLEILDDTGGVNVVDYKTGKPKSRNVIEGKTKSSRGDYKRQLVFYRLLLDLVRPQKFFMLSGEIDFIEPDEKGRYHKERFEITGEEVQELKELIAHTAREILTLSFWNTRCDKKYCEYCAMRELM